MAWTELTRRRYERKSDGYSSDVTDMEWAVIAPFLPDRNRSGRPRRVDFRRVWDAFQYLRLQGARGRFCHMIFRRFQPCVLFLPLA